MENAEKIEIAEALYQHGTEDFAKGKYQAAAQSLTRCLSIEKDEEDQYLETNAYNMLGMLSFFVGYEASALDYYLSALESARKQYNIEGMITALLNIGLLYQAGKEYGRAMSYYMQAKEAAEQDLRSQDMLLVLYADIQIAQLYCRLGQYGEAKGLYMEIEKFVQIAADGEFLLTKKMLDILLAVHEVNHEKIHRLVEEMIVYMKTDEQFIEQADFYVDICEILFSYGKVKEMRVILDFILDKLKDTDFYRLKIRAQQLEISYQKEYGREKEYKEACKSYIMLYFDYETLLKQLKKKNLENMSSMQKVEEQKREFERRSRHDLATGLLNKKAFRHEAEKQLMEHSAGIMRAMIFLDIDNFKFVNDCYGHMLGDEVIRTLADTIQKHFKENCVCGRFGGDEFTIFMREVEDMLNLEMQIEAFREAFSKIAFGEKKDLYVTLSIGASYNKGMRVSFQAMLTCADEALEKAKEYGKNRVSFYEITRGIYNYA